MVLYLLIIAFVSAFLTSFSASALNTFIRPLFGNLSRFSAIDDFYIAFQNLKFGIFLSYLLLRIPIIVLDRLISTFLDYEIYRVPAGHQTGLEGVVAVDDGELGVGHQGRHIKFS